MSDVEAPTGCFRPTPPGGKKPVLVELRNFLLGGDFIKLAAAFVIALALQKLIDAFVGSLVTPWLGVIGSRSFQELDFAIRGSKFQYGLLLDAFISFVVIVLSLFFCLILPLQRCPHCTSELVPEAIYKGRAAARAMK